MLGGLPLSSASPLPLCCLARRAVKLSAAPWLDPPGAKATGHCRAQGHFGTQHCGQKATSPIAPPEGFKTSPKSPPKPSQNLSAAMGPRIPQHHVLAGSSPQPGAILQRRCKRSDGRHSNKLLPGPKLYEANCVIYLVPCSCHITDPALCSWDF